MSYRWDFTWVVRHWDALAWGLTETIALTVVAVALGTLVAPLLVLMRTSRRRALEWPAALFIEIFRDLPVLVVIVWLFFCLPAFLGSAARISPFWIAVLGLGLNYLSLEAEIMRAAYESIPIGQIEAARGLQLTSRQIVRHISIPQILWRSLPPTLGQIVNTIKLSSLASFIAVPELFYQTSSLIQDTYRPLEFYTTMALLYLALILPLSLVFRTIETRLNSRFHHD